VARAAEVGFPGVGSWRLGSKEEPAEVVMASRQRSRTSGSDGAYRDRTGDLRLAKTAEKLVGVGQGWTDTGLRAA
jgi:hypothetical protein